MDTVVRYWNNINNQVSVCYWNSNFLGHTIAVDILSKFNDAVSTVDPNGMIQVSMDGPKTNMKFLELLKSHRYRLLWVACNPRSF